MNKLAKQPNKSGKNLPAVRPAFPSASEKRDMRNDCKPSQYVVYLSVGDATIGPKILLALQTHFRLSAADVSVVLKESIHKGAAPVAQGTYEAMEAKCLMLRLICQFYRMVRVCLPCALHLMPDYCPVNRVNHCAGC